MKRMYYVLLCAITIAVMGCSDDNQKPAADRTNELGLVVQSAASTTDRTLLLEDGTVAKPVSGIPDFNERTAGTKLLVSFRTLGVEDGITQIAVTHFTAADDSVFVPNPGPTGPDSIYDATYNGNYFVIGEDSTVTYWGDVTFTFDSNGPTGSTYTYSFTPEEEGSPVSGSGEFFLNGDTITFSNNEDDDAIVPNGEFAVLIQSGRLYIWRSNERFRYDSYSLEREHK